MATSSSFLSEDQLQCSICLDVFTEPVTVPCGHNFCKACLSQHWAGRDRCLCPLCNEKFSKGFKLCVNTVFREIVENFKKNQVKAGGESSVNPGEVPCDYCPGDKIKASKTCVVRLASFCQAHLEPHLRVPALKRHKLTNPVHELESKICEKHNRIVEFFCRDDHARACAMCAEHGDHDTVHLKDTYVDQQSHIWKRREQVLDAKEQQGKCFKVANHSKKNSKDGGRAKRLKQNKIRQGPVPHHRNPLHSLHECIFTKNAGVSPIFFEVDVKRRVGWSLGLVKESMLDWRRCPPVRGGDRWLVWLGDMGNTDRVLVSVDHDNGLVLLCDPKNSTFVYNFTGSSFTEDVYLLFYPGQFKPVWWVEQLKPDFQNIREQLVAFLAVFAMALILLWVLHILLME